MSKLLVICLMVFVFPTFVFADVIINEIAWMGTSVSTNDEWIELYNGGSESVDLSSWHLIAIDGQPDISFGDACVNTTISAGGYFLLERTDDDSVSGISADCIYTGALGNTSERLQLLNTGGSVADSVDASDGWPAGNNTTKETMQRSGSTWITALATPKAVNVSTGSKTDPDNSSPPNTNNTSQAGGADEPYVQPENLPRIKADAGGDKRASVGEQVQFRGNAWGLDDAFLENGRYAWNFGDGATYEGQNVGHEYMFPGTYTVRLVVSSGKYSASDDVRVVVGNNTIQVSEVLPGDTGWIELHNKGLESIHVGGWIVETKEARFTMPLGTTIAPQSFVVLSAGTTRLSLKKEGDHANLFYPNGTCASGITYVFEVPRGKSVSSNADVIVFTDPTPGNPNNVEHPAAPSMALQPMPIPIVSKISVQSDTALIPPQKIPVVKEDPSLIGNIEEPAKKEVSVQPANLLDAPALSKTNREALWFGGSLILGGLAAVGVMLFRRRKNFTGDTIV